MFKVFVCIIFLYSILTRIQCDITNVNEFLSVLKQNNTIPYGIGFMTQANADIASRYLRGNVKVHTFDNKHQILNAIDNETIIAAITTGQLAQDLEPGYHVFSSLMISPQAMLVAPDYNEIIAPYGLQNQSSNDLFSALNAAIADVQREDIDETLLVNANLTNLARAYTCRQDRQLPVPNRNETTGILRDILLNNMTLLIGGIGPKDWGIHDGNYSANVSIGFYPTLLDAIVKKLASIKGPDGIVYNDKINFRRIFYDNITVLFRALLDGKVHATDVYVLIDAPYTGTGEVCTDDLKCRARESCVDGNCTHPARPRSLHFRPTCTTASRDTKFITKKDSKMFQTNTDKSAGKETPKTRWIGFLLIFVALFGSIFITLLIMVRRKKYYRVEQTFRGGLGKFARLQEEAEPPLEAMDAFDDHIVQSPRDNNNSTS